MSSATRVVRALLKTLFHTVEGWIAVMAGPVSIVLNFFEKRSAVNGVRTDATAAWSTLVWVSGAAGVVSLVRVLYRYQAQILELERPPALRAAIVRKPEHGRPTSFHFFLRVQNDGPTVAHNVQATLLGVDPRPRYGAFRGLYPQPVGLPINRAFATALTTNPTAHSINPSQPISLPLADTWLSGGEAHRYLAGIDGFDDRADGMSKTDLTRLDEGEVVQLHIRVSAANVQPVDVRVVVTPRGDDLHMRIVDEADS